MMDDEIDDLMRRAAHAEPIDTRRMEQAVRARIYRRRWPWFGAAMAAMAGFIAWGLVSVASSIPKEFRDAARDHRAEVIEHRPRHWKTAPQDLSAIGSQYRITAPAGFSLKEAKRCGIGGKPVMHLVYTDGKRDVSVYVTGKELRGRSSVDGQYVGGFRRGLVVGSTAECRQFLDVLQRST